MEENNKFLALNEINEYIMANNLNKSEIIDFLSIIIDETRDNNLRAAYISLFDKLNVNDKKVFLFLEHLLISDESPIVRGASAKIMIKRYPDEMVLPLIYAIQKDKSFNVLNVIHQVILRADFKSKNILIEEFNKRVNKIASNFNIVPQEALFLMHMGFNEILYKDTLSSDNFNITYGNNNMMCAIRKKHIRAISISSWKHENLPKSIANLSRLTYLNLSCNDLSLLPKSMESLSRLRYLDLGWNNFIKIPSFLENFNSSKYLRLDLDHNEIEKIPKWIRKLRNIKYLNLKNNKIRKIPNSIGLLKSLEVLDLRENEIEIIPNSIGLLSSLKELLLSGNRIRKIPKTLSLLKSLEVLDLGSNYIEKVPKELKKLNSLRSLNLKNNKISNSSDSIITSTHRK